MSFAGLPVDSYAHEQEPWALDYFRELNSGSPAYDLILGLVNRDVTGRYVNVRDGRRETYRVHSPTATVWFFGGSTMFGIGQRDHHTIPSVIVRLAEHDGIRLEAMNFGVAADANWQETLRFAQTLQSDLPKPDLVVFYDGWNDQSVAEHRVETGNTDPNHLGRLPVNKAEQEAERRTARGWSPPEGPDRVELVTDLAAGQYRRGVEIGRLLARSHGVPIVHFWHPFGLAKRASPADDELYRRLAFRPEWLPDTTRAYRAILVRSGVDAIDLSQVLDDVRVPVFFDQGHTNELGARIVGTAMYRHLRELLDEHARR